MCFGAMATAQDTTRRLGGTNTACGKERVRKSWKSLTVTEKTLYKQALTSAMKTREFFEFSKIHMDDMSERQAHDTCAFLI